MYILARNGSGFESYVVLNNLLQWRTVASLIRNGSGIVSLKISNGSVDGNKKNLNMCILDVVEYILIIG